MKKDQKKNIIIVVLIVVVVVCLVIIGLFASGKMSVKEINDTNNQEQQNDNEVYDESDFVRQTKVTLVEEPNCNGTDSAASLVAAIESNGDISISQSYAASIVQPGNAKYLYHVNILACDVATLYYITEDNSLYVLENPRADIDQTATKVTESKVVEFLGEDKNEYGYFLKVLLENGKVKYINYFMFSE